MNISELEKYLPILHLIVFNSTILHSTIEDPADPKFGCLLFSANNLIIFRCKNMCFEEKYKTFKKKMSLLENMRVQIATPLTEIPGSV
jgi:hypothetical protein